MPDFDVAALGLATPPNPAPVETYTPAVSVVNLGIEAAICSGTLQLYDRATGVLIKTFVLASTSIAVGQTKSIPATESWTPTTGDIGRHFLWAGFIDYAKDQNLPNNQLQPVDVIITSAPPPPPPPVALHASQHEDGGSDELNLDGLPGKLAEHQDPTSHASTHEAGDIDELNVAGLTGELVTPQTPKTHAVSHETGGTDPIVGLTPGLHASSHQDGGTDPINVAGLSGLLADAQNPTSHMSTHKMAGTDKAATFAIDGKHDWNFTPDIACPPTLTTTVAQMTISSPASTVNPAGILIIGHALIGIPDSGPGLEGGTIKAAVDGAYSNYQSTVQLPSGPSWQYVSIPIVSWHPSPGAAASYVVSLGVYNPGTLDLSVSTQSLHALIII